MNNVLLYCRRGFEKECAAEISDRAAQLGVAGFVRLIPLAGYVLFVCAKSGEAARLLEGLPFCSLIFARQMLVTGDLLDGLPAGDRLAPVVEALRGLPCVAGDVRVEVPDTEVGKPLLTFCRKFTVPLRQALRQAGCLAAYAPRGNVQRAEAAQGLERVSAGGVQREAVQGESVKTSSIKNNSINSESINSESVNNENVNNGSIKNDSVNSEIVNNNSINNEGLLNEGLPGDHRQKESAQKGLTEKETAPMAAAQPEKRQIKSRQTQAASPPESGLVAHVVFVASGCCYVGYSLAGNHSPFYMGIPRLKLPPDAPSRSTLKLEEALQVFIPKAQWAKRLASGMRAVDLGACPGGWSYQLVRRNMRVCAVDNGPMAQSLLDSGLVDWLREDGFKYRPPRPVDWMLCDMAEKPAKVAALVARWLVNGWCRETIFNLKLPMKKRYQAVRDILDGLTTTLAEAGVPARLQARQLYHDREEITVHIQRVGGWPGDNG